LRADKLLLATRWITEAQQQHGKAVLDRYQVQSINSTVFY
jgi:hypothetical protein